ncbi:unnamed protein product [Gongylonema pulchrum]|uniref:Glyco_transf_7C domain-containing protein n=1 Tax=Gongylonema pulchrum TaxID=637853 RepID=A0A183ES19_9BILA|nr:unnamed protein product [Gongylonema pulchrum]
MMPEHIYSTHVHEVLKTEKNSGTVKYLAPEAALVFHLRRVMPEKLWSTNSTKQTNALAKFIQTCNNSWKKRLKTIARIPEAEILHGSIWPNRGTEVIQEMEACRENLTAQQGERCAAPYRCISELTAVNRSEWIFAQQTWVAL